MCHWGNQKGLLVAKGHSGFWLQALAILFPVCPAALLADGIGALDAPWGTLPKETTQSTSERASCPRTGLEQPSLEPPFTVQQAITEQGSLTTRQAFALSLCLWNSGGHSEENTAGQQSPK